MKKFLALLLAGCLAVSLAACEEKRETSTQTSGESNELSWWVKLYPNIAQTASSFSEIPLYQEVAKRTNTKINFIHPAAGQESEQFNLMLASGDLPDIITWDFLASYKGGPQKAIDDGIIIDLDPYLKEYAPNYMKVLKEHPEWEKESTLDSGKHYTMASFRGDDYLLCWFGPQIRKDLLDKAGLPVPETIDEWDKALRAFKDMGVKYPLTAKGLQLHWGWLGAYGVAENYYQDNGVVKYAPIEMGYKDFVSQMAIWYRDGLLDNDFATQDAKTFDAKILSGEVGGFCASAGGGMGNYIPVLSEKIPGAQLIGTKYPSLVKGEKSKYGQKDNNYFSSTSVCITSSAKDPAAIVKFLDYGYSEEGHMLYNFGIEGESYEMKDGYPKYTDLITHNSEGLNMATAMCRYMASSYCGPFVQDKRYYEQYLQYDEQKEAVKAWGEHDAVLKLPPLTFTEEESSFISAKTTEIDTYVKEGILKFIMGQTPISEYDNFVSNIKKMGVDDVLKVYQDAYDRYTKR